VVAANTTAGGHPSRFDRLGTWIGLPLLALVLMGLLFAALPETACDESANDSVGAWGIFLLGIGAAVGCLVAAVVRVIGLSRRPGGIPRWQIVTALAVVGVLLAVAGTVVSVEGEPSFYWQTWVAATPATVIALLVLLVAAALRRRANDVGLLLPAYLIGAGLFVIPSLALLGAIFKSDALCS
jgi:hypothetical protein